MDGLLQNDMDLSLSLSMWIRLTLCAGILRWIMPCLRLNSWRNYVSRRSQRSLRFEIFSEILK